VKRIVIFSMAPMFPDLVHGGSQKTLTSVLEELSARGHKCVVLCTRRLDNFRKFTPFPNVRVSPTLRFKPTYPEPYYTAPFHLASVLDQLALHLKNADVLYVHDSELLFSKVAERVPSVWGVQDLVYPDTLAGVFAFRGDHLIVPSSYLKSCLLNTFGRSAPRASTVISLIPNGFDTASRKVSRNQREALKRRLGVPRSCTAILYPHRPDPRKGLVECLKIIKAAQPALPASLRESIRLLVPVWIDSRIAGDSTHDYQTLYTQARRFAEELGLGDVLHFHPWLRPHDMPIYYSIGHVTLCVGNFVESFGNVSIESQLAGTPAIVSRVGAQRSVLPEALTWKCDYGATEEAAEALARLLIDSTRVPSEFRAYVREAYSERKMKAGYADAIERADRCDEVAVVPRSSKLKREVKVPPWCAVLRKGYYNDYSYDYISDAKLLTVAKRAAEAPLELAQVMTDFNIARTELRRWVDDGHLTLE
jgi:glycosyltransferase involved in cell wall biosynthesis